MIAVTIAIAVTAALALTVAWQAGYRSGRRSVPNAERLILAGELATASPRSLRLAYLKHELPRHTFDLFFRMALLKPGQSIDIESSGDDWEPLFELAERGTLRLRLDGKPLLERVPERLRRRNFSGSVVSVIGPIDLGEN